MIHHHTRMGWFLRRFWAWYKMARQHTGHFAALRGAWRFSWSSAHDLARALDELAALRASFPEDAAGLLKRAAVAVGLTPANYPDRADDVAALLAWSARLKAHEEE